MRAIVMHDPVWIGMSDGVRLAACIWRPEDAEADPVPAILEYLPYRRRDGTAFRDARMHPWFAARGYACVRVDMRGTGDSDGLLLDEYLPIEQQDALEVIDWIAHQPWCTGAVGMMGLSWGGVNALQVAACRPPALRAIISVCATDDRYATDVHHMGGAVLVDVLRWSATMLGYQSRPPDPAVVGDRGRDMWVERLQAQPLFLETWLAHPARDTYWRRGSVCEDPGAIVAATYLIGGWADAYASVVPHLLARLTCPRKGLIGPWGHRYPHAATPGPAIGFLQEALRWWDHWLKGRDMGVMEEPLLRVWMQEYVPPATEHVERPGHWIAETGWPSPNVTPQAWHLGDGVLSRHPLPPAACEVASPQDVGEMAGSWCAYGGGHEHPGDQRADDGRSLVFDSAKLAERVELLGAPVLQATVVADQPDALLVVRLCDVASDGASLRVSYGVLNLTHRASHETPEPLPVGQPVTVRLQLYDCAHAFPPGHRIRLALATAYWPLVWPSPRPVRLRLDTASACLILPYRSPAAADATLPPFPPPESSPGLKRTRMTAPALARRSARDHVGGAATYEVVEDTGRFRIEATGLEYRLASTERYAIHPDDPLSARAEMAFEMGQGRGEWQTRAVSRTVPHATEQAFLIEATLDAWDGGQCLVARKWEAAIPRDRV